VAEDERLHIPVMLTLTTGLRNGEIAVLAWTNGPFDRAPLRVTTSHEQAAGARTEGGQDSQRTPNDTSLPSHAAGALRAHRAPSPSTASMPALRPCLLEIS
jgi:hypothetical protein